MKNLTEKEKEALRTPAHIEIYDLQEKATQTTKCILCNTYFKGFGHNPAPLESNKFRCCDICNDTEVIPFRIYKLKQRKG